MSNIYGQTDTIAAIATPLGTGGVGIVRISGEKSEDITSKIFSLSPKEKKLPVFEANRIYHGWVCLTPTPLPPSLEGREGKFDAPPHQNTSSSIIPVDEVVVLCFKSPNSYTGEDVFEIQCHGGINVTKNILKLCINSGARLSERGEFSKRAFMNAKLDLSEAEAVLDLNHAKTDRFSRAAAGNLSGRLANHIKNIRKELLDLLSMITAAVDFPEDVPEPKYSFIEEKLNSFISKIDDVLKTANSSNLMRDGIKIVLAGKPNVGKSSLFNALLDMERAIVTEIAGTTRDILQESIDIDGIPAVLTDTAGIRKINSENSNDYIESIGINNTKNFIENADIVLFIYDLTQGIQSEDKEIYDEIQGKKIITVGSKADLYIEEKARVGLPNGAALLLSAKEKTGLEELKEKIKNLVAAEDLSDEFCTNTRQQECLKTSKNALEQALISCQNQEIQDLILIDLKSAVISLGEITGEVVSEEVLNNIFDNFCIGK